MYSTPFKLMQIETWPLERIKPYHANARKAKKGNDEAAVAALAKVLIEFGWRQPIVVDKKGVIVIGHRRRKAAALLNWTEAPVHVATNLTPAQIKALRIADNRVHEDTTWDLGKLGGELGSLHEAGLDLALTGFEASELEQLMNFDADALAALSKDLENDEETGDGDKNRVEDTTTPAASNDTKDEAGTVSNDTDHYAYAVRRPALNKKRTCRFLSLRRWRGDLKDKGLEAFKSMKAGCNAEDVDRIAGEFAEVLTVLVGGLKHWAVTAPPSSKKRLHFASELARRFAELTGAEYVQLFEDRPRKSSSHPAHWDKRGDMKLAEGAEYARVLILDDVSTSGTTIEQATGALRERSPEASILSAVWIYENA